MFYLFLGVVLENKNKKIKLKNETKWKRTWNSTKQVNILFVWPNWNVVKCFPEVSISFLSQNSQTIMLFRFLGVLISILKYVISKKCSCIIFQNMTKFRIPFLVIYFVIVEHVINIQLISFQTLIFEIKKRCCLLIIMSPIAEF